MSDPVDIPTPTPTPAPYEYGWPPGFDEIKAKDQAWAEYCAKVYSGLPHL